MTTDDVLRATRAARRYRDMGLSPLPSSKSKKAPTLPVYAHHQSEPLEESYFEGRNWETTNVQLMCGMKAYGPKKIVVVDCDGSEAVGRFEAICAAHGFSADETWQTVTGGGGRHLYFLAPPGTKGVASGLIWGLWDTYGLNGSGGWAKHQEVRILGDGSLVVAPPSIHVETGVRYRFHLADPVNTPIPAVCPDWLLAMPRLTAPRFKPEVPRLAPLVKTSTSPVVRFLDRNVVLDAIADKVALAASWGLSFARPEPNSAGWCSCYAVGREDRTPSASFEASTGCYQDRRDMRVISLFDLGVILQPAAFARWQDCRDWCASVYVTPKENFSAYAQACRLADARE